MNILNFCTELTDYEAIIVVGGATTLSSGSDSSRNGFSKALAKYKSKATGNITSASGSSEAQTTPSSSLSKSNSLASSGIVIGS